MGPRGGAGAAIAAIAGTAGENAEALGILRGILLGSDGRYEMG